MPEAPLANATYEGMRLPNMTEHSGLQLLEDAQQPLDLDALEFSPVYHCLLQSRFFDYFTTSCVDTCPAEAEVYVGQCVRKTISAKPVTLEAAWSLELSCGTSCWHDKLNVTMHHVRISVADMLEVPFQEVRLASLTISRTVSSRRLDDNSTAIHLAVLKVAVESARVTEGDRAKLDSLVPEAQSASWLLGFKVHKVTELSDDAVEFGDSETAMLTDASDPYSSAYTEASPSSSGRGNNAARAASGPISLLPMEASIAGGVVVVVLGLCGLVLLRRRKRINAAYSGEIPVVTGRRPDEANPQLSALGEYDDGPMKPSTLGAIYTEPVKIAASSPLPGEQ